MGKLERGQISVPPAFLSRRLQAIMQRLYKRRYKYALQSLGVVCASPYLMGDQLAALLRVRTGTWVGVYEYAQHSLNVNHDQGEGGMSLVHANGTSTPRSARVLHSLVSLLREYAVSDLVNLQPRPARTRWRPPDPCRPLHLGRVAAKGFVRRRVIIAMYPHPATLNVALLTSIAFFIIPVDCEHQYTAGHHVRNQQLCNSHGDGDTVLIVVSLH